MVITVGCETIQTIFPSYRLHLSDSTKSRDRMKRGENADPAERSRLIGICRDNKQPSVRKMCHALVPIHLEFKTLSWRGPCNFPPLATAGAIARVACAQASTGSELRQKGGLDAIRAAETSEGDMLRPLAVSVVWIGLWISLFIIVKTSDRDSSHSTTMIRALAL